MRLICLDCRYINGRPSGIAEMVGELVRHLPILAPDLRFRLLVSPDAPVPLNEAPNVEELRVAASCNGPATMWWLPRVADLSGVDVFHATFNILPAGLTMPTVTTVHDLMWLDHPDWCESGWRRPFRKAFFTHGINRALHQSTCIATVSEATRRAIIARDPMAAPRTFATQSGVSESFAPVAVRPQELAALGLDPNRRFILTVGQYAPYKNHVGAIRAFARACAEKPDIEYILVQRQGRRAEELLALAAQLGVGGRVHILPAVTQDDLIRLYSAAALLLHPSLCEGFGHPLAEAMACGCPVITSDRSAMPEVTGDAALLADPEDEAALAAHIAAILGDPGLAVELSAKGKARAAQLRWKDFAAANLSLYRKALRQA